MDSSLDLFSDISDADVAELLNRADELLSSLGEGLPTWESLNGNNIHVKTEPSYVETKPNQDKNLNQDGHSRESSHNALEINEILEPKLETTSNIEEVFASNSAYVDTHNTIQINSQNISFEDDDDIIFVSSEVLDVPIIDLCGDSYNIPRVTRIKKRNSGNTAQIIEINNDNSIIEINDSIPNEKNLRLSNVSNSIPNEKNLRLSNVNNTVMMQCPICLESAIGNRPTSTSCGHIFCNSCIRQCLQIKKSCPSCKKSLKLSNIHPIYL